MNLRMERIERLLNEIQYEITRGMMEGEVDEVLGFEFLVPISKSVPKGVVHCSFRTRPQAYAQFMPEYQGKLRSVK